MTDREKVTELSVTELDTVSGGIRPSLFLKVEGHDGEVVIASRVISANVSETDTAVMVAPNRSSDR